MHLYYLWASLLVAFNLLACFATLLTLPGNWFIVAATAVFALIYNAPGEPGISWWTVGGLVGLALLGEVLEFAAGAMGAAKHGGTRRGMLLSLVGAAVGSIWGAFLTLPIPLVGPLFGALGGGALGAFCGAFLGEKWAGKTTGQSAAVGKGAFIGRLLGTGGKMAIGMVMVIVAAFDAFYTHAAR
jgi:hypothetical protein